MNLGTPSLSSTVNQADVSRLEISSWIPRNSTPIHEYFDTLNIVGQAQSFASIVIQTHWRRFSCRKKRNVLQRSEDSSARMNWNNEKISQCMTYSPSKVTNDNNLVPENQSMRNLKAALPTRAKRLDDVGMRSHKLCTANTAPKNPSSSRKIKSRVVKKVPCVTLNFQTATGDKTANLPAVPTTKINRNANDNEQRCFSSQSHKRMSVNHPTIPSNHDSSRPKTAILSRSQVVNYKKGKGSVASSPSPASTRLESAINNFIHQRQRKEEKDTVTDDFLKQTSNIREQETSASNVIELEKTPCKPHTTVPVLDSSDRLAALLVKLRSLNPKM